MGNESLAGIEAADMIHQRVKNCATNTEKEASNTINPKSYDDLLKIIGFAHSINVWKNNAEILFN